MFCSRNGNSCSGACKSQQQRMSSPPPPHSALNNLKWDDWEPWWSVFVLFKLSKKLMSHRKYFSLVPLAGSNHLQQLLNRLPNFKYIWQKNRDLKGIMLQIQHSAKLWIPPSPWKKQGEFNPWPFCLACSAPTGMNISHRKECWPLFLFSEDRRN